MEQPVTVKLDSKHDGFVVKRWVYNLFSIIRWLLNVGIVLYISRILYSECLFIDKDKVAPNPIVISYFCLISLGCFLNIGIPIDKLANISLTGK